jgi:hypothetical protein
MIFRYKDFLPRRFLKLLAAFLIVATSVGSFLPRPVKSTLGTDPINPTSTHIGIAHRIYHFSTFGSIAFTLLLLASGTLEEIQAVLFASTLAWVIEITQRLADPFGVFEWWDVRDDLWAITLATFSIALINGAACSQSNKLFRTTPRIDNDLPGSEL